MYNQASLRQYGDHQHFVAYVEVEHPAYNEVKKLKPDSTTPYYIKMGMKIVASDFYFKYTKENKDEIRHKLEMLLHMKCKRGV